MDRYGIYSNNLERFIYVDNDLWILMHSAKLLSSKMMLCVINIKNDNLNSNNCFEYSLSNPEEAKQSYQLPQLVTYSTGETFKGPPVDINLDTFTKHRIFIEYVIRTVRASWLTDAQFNVSDHNFLINLLGDTSVRKVNDDSGVDKGFKFCIDQILYTANTLEELKTGIDNIFNYADSNRPKNLKIYEQTFRKYMRK